MLAQAGSVGMMERAVNRATVKGPAATKGSAPEPRVLPPFSLDPAESRRPLDCGDRAPTGAHLEAHTGTGMGGAVAEEPGRYP
jgi:hypothetical protein